MAKRKTFHLVHNPDGGWDLKGSGTERVSGHYKTKKEAEAAAREISRNQGSELIIHGKNGRIQSVESRELTLTAFQKAYDSHRDKNH